MLKRKDVDRILMTMLRAHKGASDLNFTVGKPLQVEASGKLVPVNFNPAVDRLTPYQTEMLALGVIGGDRANLEALVKQGSADCAYAVPGEARFRVNVFQQRKQHSLVLRKLETKILSMADLGLPDIFKTMAAEKNGLILVTGSTGSGKSTTLAAVLNEMNETRAIHILTIEDPVEYVHPHKKATFNQRELGTDFDTFHSSLRAALRQAPKVILIGEMRDRATVDIGLAAASTGHLVLSTLHSIDCGQTINRIVGMFDKEEEDQIRARLQECLRFVVNQRLLPKKGGGRVACQEIMGMNLRVKELLINGESEGKSFYEAIGDARALGWQTHDQCITDLYAEDKIDEETAYAYASNRPILMRAIDRLKQERGIRDENELVLALDSSSKEVAKLIKTTWPNSGTPFPIRGRVDDENFVILYTPNVEIKGGTATMLMPITGQNKLPGTTMINPKGEVVLSAKTSGGDGILVSFTHWSIERLVVAETVLEKGPYKLLYDAVKPLLPDKIELPNSKFTPIKQEALEKIAQLGKLQHMQALKDLLAKAVDEKEIAHLKKTMDTIKERGQ